MKTGFEIIDPVLEESQARLEAMRTGRYMGTLRPRPPSKRDAKQTGHRHTVGMMGYSIHEISAVIVVFIQLLNY